MNVSVRETFAEWVNLVNGYEIQMANTLVLFNLNVKNQDFMVT